MFRFSAKNYVVDFTARTCAYFERESEKYIEDYPGVAID
jgi:uncharacterized protein YbcV (DUF1398 family)